MIRSVILAIALLWIGGPVFAQATVTFSLVDAEYGTLDDVFTGTMAAVGPVPAGFYWLPAINPPLNQLYTRIDSASFLFLDNNGTLSQVGIFTDTVATAFCSVPQIEMMFVKKPAKFLVLTVRKPTGPLVTVADQILAGPVTEEEINGLAFQGTLLGVPYSWSGSGP